MNAVVSGTLAMKACREYMEIVEYTFQIYSTSVLLKSTELCMCGFCVQLKDQFGCFYRYR